MRNDIFYKIWKANTDAELQAIAGALKLEDLPTVYTVASGKVNSGNPGRDNRQGPLSGVTAYWIPSTNSLFSGFSRNPSVEDIEDVDRIAFFEALIDPTRDTNPNLPASQPITTIYLDVLAPAGATIHRSNSMEGNYLSNNLIHNILENNNFTRENDLLYDDALSEFVSAAKTKNVDLSKITLSAWIEGSAYALPGTLTDASGRQYTNQLYSNEAVLGTDGSGVAYLDLLDENVFQRLQNFILDVAQRPEVDDIMLDDHFGIHRDVLTKAKEKYTTASRAAWDYYRSTYDPGVAQSLEFRNFSKFANFSDDVTIQWLRNRISGRLSQLKTGLASVEAQSGKSVSLSVSVNPFDFVYDNPGTATDPAMSINTQDVAAWLEQGLITGVLNVQLYRSSAEALIPQYNKLKDVIAQHLTDKRQQLGNTFNNYLNAFPKISISVAQIVNNTALPLANVQAQADYINSNSLIFSGEQYGGKNIIADVVGFDFHRFENLKNGTVSINNGVNQPTGGSTGEPWGIP
jgi:uncharacterized lipoprotein YddW (UPF0748 family)